METNNLKIIGQIKKLFFIVLATVVFTLLMSVSSVRAELQMQLQDDGTFIVGGTGEVTEAIVKDYVGDRSKIKRVYIREFVDCTTNSFIGCENLSTIEVNQNNQKLKSEDGVLYRSVEATQGKYGLVCYPVAKADTYFEIPSNVEAIVRSALSNCKNLKFVTIRSNYIIIAGLLFYNCTNLKFVLIPYTFTGDINSGDVMILRYITDDQGNITMVWVPNDYEIPAGSVVLDSAAILRYTKDANGDITINGVSANKDKLTSLSIPKDVVAIDEQAFYQCTNLKTVTFEDGSRLTTIGDGALGSAFEDCSSLENITIPATVTTMNAYAFASCENLETVTFAGSGLVEMSAYVFDGCEKLKSIEIPADVTTISDYAFANCKKLETVKFAGSKLTTIGKYAFHNCDSLSSFIIPATVTQVGQYAFYNCDNLTTVLALETCDISNAGFGTNTNVLRYIADDQENIITVLVPADYELPGSLGIPVSAVILRYIKDESGDITVTDVDNKNITSVVISASVVKIDNNVFESFTNLKIVLFAEGSKLTTIGTQVFRGCSSLESIELPSSVTSIGQHAFYGCSSLKVISIPASVTVIRSQAFRNCTSLTTVSFADESSLTQINANAFNGCTSLKVITIPASVTSIGDKVFINCDKLKTVIFTQKSDATTLTITPSMFPKSAYVLSGGSVTPLTGDMDVTSSGNVTIKILVSVTPTKKLGSEDSTPLLEVDTDVEHYELKNSILVPRMVSLSLAAPDESDYEFLGWFRAGTDDVLLCELPTYDLIIKDDVSCEARYISGQKAIFKAYDVLTYTSIAGATSITMLAAPVPNYGWAFTGWKCEGDDELIAAGATYDIPEGMTGDITFTAQFQPIGSVVEDETVSVTVNGGQAQSIPIGWFTVLAEPPEGKYFDHWVQTIGNRTVTSYLNPGTFWVAEDCSIEAVYSDTPVAQIATAKLMSHNDDEFTFFITAPGTITEVGAVASSADDVSTANLIIGNTAVEYVRCVSKEMKRNSRTLNWRISALNSTWSVRPYVIYKVAGDTEGEVKTITTYGARSTKKNFKI